MLKRLYSLALHPSAAKRLGAALAFNNIYTIFRQVFFSVLTLNLTANLDHLTILTFEVNTGLSFNTSSFLSIVHFTEFFCAMKLLPFDKAIVGSIILSDER